MFVLLSGYLFWFCSSVHSVQVCNLKGNLFTGYHYLYHVIIEQTLCASLTYCAFCVQICRGFNAEPLLYGTSGTLGSEQTWNWEPVQQQQQQRWQQQPNWCFRARDLRVHEIRVERERERAWVCLHVHLCVSVCVYLTRPRTGRRADWETGRFGRLSGRRNNKNAGSRFKKTSK